jgi:hypothetical protein
MKLLRSSLAAATVALLVGTMPLSAQQKRTSPHESIYARIGSSRTLVSITYGRPYTKDPKTGEARKVWGTLVPWDKAYRLGADEATLLLTPSPLQFGDTTVPAGAYTLYLVPSENGTTKLAISTAIGKWGIPVDETHDLGRVDMKKETLPSPVDQLTLALENDQSSGGGVLKVMWETTQFSVPFTVKK